MTIIEYPVLSVPLAFELQKEWDSPLWQQAPALPIAAFRPESTNHRPQTEVKLLCSPVALHGFFRVRDRYVRCVHDRFQQPVYQDSCVEFFVQPQVSGGYFNFEFNCGGSMLASYIVDPTRTEHGFRDFTPLTMEQGSQVSIYHSLPVLVEPEITNDLTWFIEFRLPFALLEKYVGPLGEIKGQVWRANFYKCGDKTSHPHWAAWSPVDELNFHLPHCFGRITF
ncbi:MAG: carbohydrate-binding family 9-like protein [Proteobacteria bacterium]|nr:carbohydrate-binding family 9-like protein [Pseudomonadota bacterium]MBU4295415.1 carbohydrate-binding family 9-like protein [Pseudomonadota bacterium]MCG2748933.1 carbohydrate-binding family 9-like protein [Desulfobulbaceae bacterium]